MENNKIITITRICLIAILFCGLISCIYFYPTYILNNKLINDSSKMYLIIFYEIISVPCFYLLFDFWSITNKMKNDDQFSYSVAKNIKKDSIILFTSSIVLLIGNIIFSIININVLSLYNIVLVLIAFFASIFLAILSYYISKAAFLKEETDGLI